MKRSMTMFVIALAASITLMAEGFQHIPDVAQYQGADWDNLVKIERNISVEKAQEIANSDENIGYFFFTKGFNLVLSTPKGLQRFGYGDVAFFSGTPWWGTAHDLADGYIKN